MLYDEPRTPIREIFRNSPSQQGGNHKSQDGNPASDIGGAIHLFDIAVRSKMTGFCHDCCRRPGNQLRPLAFAAGVKPREG